jgi:Pyruvate/2-oxoacid:ferredoxin oxidoreductase delta subunit
MLFSPSVYITSLNTAIMIDIFVDPEKCTGCGECIRFCPKGPRIYRIVGKNSQRVAEVLDRSFCTGCTTCITACKPGAIGLVLNW